MFQNTSGLWTSLKKETNTKECFKNLIKRIIALSSNQEATTEECFAEWSRIDMFEERDEFCLCGHEITDIYVIVNSINNNKVQLGSKCIKRINKSALKEYNDKIKNDKKLKKQQEKECLEKQIEDEKLEYLKKHFRQCKECSEYNIELPAEHWRRWCTKCYIKKKKNVVFRS